MKSLSDCEVLRCGGPQPTAACIFLHGAGETGLETKAHFEKYLKKKAHPYITFYFPTAAKRYMKIRDKETTFWFDIKRKGPENTNAETDLVECVKVVNMLGSMVEELEATGIPRGRIAIGGFSQGGMVSMFAVYSKGLEVGAVVTISSPYSFEESTKLIPGCQIPLLSLYGQEDAIITAENMSSSVWNPFRAANIPCTIRYVRSRGHTMSKDFVEFLVPWLGQKIPPKDSSQ